MTTFSTARLPAHTVPVLPVFIAIPTGAPQHAGGAAGPLTGEQAVTLLESLPQIIWTAGPEGGLDYVSPWFYALTGAVPHNTLGWQWMQVIHPDDAPSTLTQWRQCLHTGEPYRTEHRIRRAADGVYVWHVVRAEPVRDAAGHITRWVGASVDIHEQKLREAASRDAEALEARVVERTRDLLLKNTELARANQTLDFIVHIAGHDLRSPIGNLKALLSIHHHTNNDAEKAQLMHHVQDSVRRLDGTVGGLLRILETNYSTDSLVQHLSFADSLEIVMADYGEEARRLGARLLPDFYDCPRLRYNETYLLSILRNLVSNAIKYRSPKRPLQLEIRAGRSGAFVLLSVQDNGVGMDSTQVRDKLFKPFSRLSGEGDGKGLGLHLVKNMVEKNGGCIRVESTPDVGTTFRVFLKEYE